MYGLADCNNFFVSCERVFNPSLNGRPVVVLSNNDGCIIARSNEAKALGIKMGQPLFQVRDLVRRNGVALYSCNHTLYADMSSRVMHLLRRMVPAVEVYSVDEAFLDFTGFPEAGLGDYGRDTARLLYRHTGIPVSIGIAPTKTLAKVATHLCKRYPKLRNSCFMHRPEDIEKVLRTYPVGEVWGIGRRYEGMLATAGIHTAWQLAEAPVPWVRRRMGIAGLRIRGELRGEACIGFEQRPPDKQEICTSRTFAQGLTEYDQLHQAVAAFVALCAGKLRRQKSVAGQVQVFIYTDRHRADRPQHYDNVVLPLETATDSTLELTSAATRALHRIFTPGYAYKRAGVILSDIHPRNTVPGNLFDTVDRPAHARLMEVLDRINAREGRGTLVTASQGFDSLKMHREHLSGRYTTHFDEIIRVKTG